MGQLFLETSALSPPDRDSSLPFHQPNAKESGLGMRASLIAAMEDRRAVSSREMHDEQMLSVHKCQVTDDNLVMVMSRQADASTRQAEVSAQQQQAFQVGLLAVLSELVKSNRPSSL
ncbi:hypothetical protein JOQ06_027470 [Pogonophryne albipinna]|uniref:Uncharacterized protein n=1 Tax=Pogonophryne albipinna TaxID=1090488 RepID=A0AAD6FMW8_9TELE|nr:hypothetical protein JOQ06_027470 [Pogonophryne albipinna]